jgi:hypothetical protein
LEGDVHASHLQHPDVCWRPSTASQYFIAMSQSQEAKDVNLSMADLNINKDHDTSADASNVRHHGFVH